MCLCLNEQYATVTSIGGWHVALDGLLIGDQTTSIDQQLASTGIPQHSGHMVLGERERERALLEDPILHVRLQS